LAESLQGWSGRLKSLEIEIGGEGDGGAVYGVESESVSNKTFQRYAYLCLQCVCVCVCVWVMGRKFYGLFFVRLGIKSDPMGVSF